MQSSSSPKKVSIPFANSGDKQVIPDVSQIGIVDGRASYPDGFPPLTRTPISAGGVPPYGTDMNGVLFDMSSAIRWSAAGSTYKYDSTFSTAIGGYPKGAILLNAAGDGYWQSLVENNTSNPDAGGSGWISESSGRLISIIRITASTTYTPSPGVKSIIVYCQGGGGAGGGASATTSSTASPAGGGGSGALSVARLTSGFSGAAVVVGSGGSAATGAAGGNGGASSFGASISADGGQGGARAAAFIPPLYSTPGSGGSGIVGSTLYGRAGDSGSIGICFNSVTAVGGTGAPSTFGGGGSPVGVSAAVAANGNGGGGYGAGGSGGVSAGGAGAAAGGNGSAGVVIIYEYS
ncbi:glycine-rich domain-containing protein [Serratia nevei]|uniref:glycine-rich domain-containing protein n=1 Tax=Serratia nevei TaxID=2703794 RepID=UPI003FA7854D